MPGAFTAVLLSTDAYTDEATIGPFRTPESLWFQIDAEGAALFQLAELDHAGNATWNPFEYSFSGIVGTMEAQHGIRFRPLDVNIPPRVSANLGGPIFSSLMPTTAFMDAQGIPDDLAIRFNRSPQVGNDLEVETATDINMIADNDWNQNAHNDVNIVADSDLDSVGDVNIRGEQINLNAADTINFLTANGVNIAGALSVGSIETQVVPGSPLPATDPDVYFILVDNANTPYRVPGWI